MDALVEGILDAVVREIPAYAALDRTQLTEVAAIARWATTRLLDLWVADGGLTDEDLRRFQGIGAVRAMDGRPLPAVLRAYRVAASYVMRTLTERFGDVLTVADVADASTLWLETVDLLSEAIFAGYEGSVSRIDGEGDLALGDLLNDLVLGRHSSPAALADRCRTLGITLPDRPWLVVVRPRRAEADAPALADVRALAGAAGEDRPAPYVVRGELGVVLAGGLDVAALEARLEAELVERDWVACLVRQQPLAEVARAFRLASTCLATAPPYAWQDRRVLVDGDAQVLSLLAASADADRGVVARSVLGDLVRPGQEHLLAGLDALLATGGAAAAAAALGVHPQTMRYRARRISAVTGRDPRQPWDRFVLQVARTAMGGSVSS